MYIIENDYLVLKEKKDRIVGIIDEQECGFGLWIDRSYKGKSPDNTSILYYWLWGIGEFKKFCKENGITIISYE